MNTLQTEYIYNRFFRDIRALFTKRVISITQAEKRVNKVIENMSESDEHILELLSLYNTSARIAEAEGFTTKQAARKTQAAIRRLVTPINVESVTGLTLFKHNGVQLSKFKYFSKRTLNALNRQNIWTVEDLTLWLSLGGKYLFRIPGVGQAGVIEILNMYLNEVL